MYDDVTVYALINTPLSIMINFDKRKAIFFDNPVDVSESAIIDRYGKFINEDVTPFFIKRLVSTMLCDNDEKLKPIINDVYRKLKNGRANVVRLTTQLPEHKPLYLGSIRKLNAWCDDMYRQHRNDESTYLVSRCLRYCLIDAANKKCIFFDRHPEDEKLDGYEHLVGANYALLKGLPVAEIKTPRRLDQLRNGDKFVTEDRHSYSFIGATPSNGRYAVYDCEKNEVTVMDQCTVFKTE